MCVLFKPEEIRRPHIKIYSLQRNPCSVKCLFFVLQHPIQKANTMVMAVQWLSIETPIQIGLTPTDVNE